MQATTTTVSNVKVKYLRPRYKNLKEWMDNPNNIYIGRPGIVFIDDERFPKTKSPWANPFKGGRDGTHEEIVQKYYSYITRKIKTDPKTYDLEQLRNHNLGCWCVPSMVHSYEVIGCSPCEIQCHGQILLHLLNNPTDFLTHHETK